MPRIAYVNGQYVRHPEAAVHIEDRGFQFADGVYEVIMVANGRFADLRGHLDRLERSMSELRLVAPVHRSVMTLIIREMVRRNRIRHGLVYIQITRGAAPRDFKFPKAARPTLVMTARSLPAAPNPDPKGIRVITVQDQRWPRRDIKSVALLPQVLARQAAIDAGVDDAWMVDASGHVTEGASNNAWIRKGNTLITRQADHSILKGVTRTALFALCRARGLTIAERAFTPEEARSADEAFISSANTLAMPVIEIDGAMIADGVPGRLTLELRRAYLDYVATADEDAQEPWSLTLS